MTCRKECCAENDFFALFLPEKNTEDLLARAASLGSAFFQFK